jgi:hypothetical protein
MDEWNLVIPGVGISVSWYKFERGFKLAVIYKEETGKFFGCKNFIKRFYYSGAGFCEGCVSLSSFDLGFLLSTASKASSVC